VEELIDVLKNQGMSLGALDLVLIWLAWKVHKELLSPLKVFLEEYTKQLKEGVLSHQGVVDALRDLKA
jgi:hypothetical protein